MTGPSSRAVSAPWGASCTPPAVWLIACAAPAVRVVPQSVIADAAVVDGDHADPFGCVHRASAADRHQAVAALCAVFGGARVDQLDARVCPDSVENDRLDIRAAQRFERGVKETGRLDTCVCDEERPAHAKEACLRAELLDGAKALDEAGRALIGLECVFEHRIY